MLASNRTEFQKHTDLVLVEALFWLHDFFNSNLLGLTVQVTAAWPCIRMYCTLSLDIQLILAVAIGFEGPIRSRLVENGYLGEAEPAKGMKQGSGSRAWPQQDEAEANANLGLPASSNRPMVDNTH